MILKIFALRDTGALQLPEVLRTGFDALGSPLLFAMYIRSRGPLEDILGVLAFFRHMAVPLGSAHGSLKIQIAHSISQ
jgi:hypothetical protein